MKLSKHTSMHFVRCYPDFSKGLYYIRLIYTTLLLMINKVHINCYKTNTIKKTRNDIHVAT